MHTRCDRKRATAALPRLLPALLLALSFTVQGVQPPQEISVTMGDYHYAPDVINVDSGQTIVLHLTNTDSITPHNFTLVDQAAGLDAGTDISAGTSVRISLTLQHPGTCTRYCNKKLPFMASHRERGMQGTLVVR